MSTHFGLTKDVLKEIQRHPGTTNIKIHMRLMKDGYYRDLNPTSVSSITHQLEKRGIIHSTNDGPINKYKKRSFKFYPNPGKHKLMNMTRHKQRAEPKQYTQKAKRPITKANGIDVQVLIAIGDKDTMVGLEEAREIYEKLKGIFH